MSAVRASEKNFFVLHIAIVARGTLQPGHVIGRGAFLHAGKHLVLAFGKSIHIVHEIDQQKFPVQRLGERPA